MELGPGFMSSVVIVGAGLFGSIAAKVTRAHGHDVTVIDDGRPNAGSDAAACLLKPSWASRIGQIWEEGMRVLNREYEVKTLTFRSGLGIPIDLQWVDPKQVLTIEDRSETVTRVEDGFVETNFGQRYEGNVLVATGVWANQLIPNLEPIQSKVGVAIIYKDEVEKPLIWAYAPYKQAIAFVRDPGTTWFGDGTAIVMKNWDESRINKTVLRGAQLGLNQERIKQYIVGQRPFTRLPIGIFKRVSPKTWVVTGGGKNGTILAAYYAQLFVEEIQASGHTKSDIHARGRTE